MAAAEPLQVAAGIIEAAAVDAAPRARVRAGRAGIYVLPYVAALPAWLADALVGAGAARGAPEPAGVVAAREALAEKRKGGSGGGSTVGVTVGGAAAL